jgi:hypothetical protein
MADELGDLYGKISLTDGEKTGIQVDEGDIADGREVGGKCLIGKVWTEKNVNKEAFKSVFVAPQILIVLFLIYLFDNIIQLISLRSLWYYGGW